MIYFVAIVFYKALSVLNYWGKHNNKKYLTNNEENQFTVIQPIVSGDPYLPETLRKNLTKSRSLKFIWLLDRDDINAGEVVRSIINKNNDWKNRVKVIKVNTTPKGINPKIYKLLFALPLCGTYTIVLDDDTLVDFKDLGKVFHLLKEKDCLITGIPYYRTQSGFFPSLVTAFVNSNSLFTYLPNALTGKVNTIRTDLIKKYRIFEAIQGKLCDDHEISSYARSKNIELIQSVIPCEVSTYIKDYKSYLHLMKRWMVCANIYTRAYMSTSLLILTFFPSILPLLLFIISALLGLKYLLLFIIFLTVKTSLFKFVRNKLIANKEPFYSPLFEFFADIILPFNFLYSLVAPNTVLWRKKQLNLKKDASGELIF